MSMLEPRRWNLVSSSAVSMARMVNLHMCRSGHECYPLFSGAGSSRISGAVVRGKTLAIRGHMRERIMRERIVVSLVSSLTVWVGITSRGNSSATGDKRCLWTVARPL